MMDEECASCPEGIPKHECAKSKLECGHHCNCSWDQDHCCWCGKWIGDGVEFDTFEELAAAYYA